MRGDLEFLREHGWEATILRHLRYGGKLLGICGGFQMMGKQLHDPQGVEGKADSSYGLGLLDMETTLEAEKRLAQVQGKLTFADATVTGYEIHMGVSQGAALNRPLAMVECMPEGAIAEDGAIAGTYLHGVFDHPEACKALLSWAGLHSVEVFDYGAHREAGLNRLADALQQHLDWATLDALLF